MRSPSATAACVLPGAGLRSCCLDSQCRSSAEVVMYFLVPLLYLENGTVVLFNNTQLEDVLDPMG
jgi:hypothetical protein